MALIQVSELFYFTEIGEYEYWLGIIIFKYI